MSIFILKVSLRHYPDVQRTIEIPSDFKLISLHHALLNSINFKDGELASFYKNYESRKERIEVCLSELQKDDHSFLMSEMAVKDLIHEKGDEIIYVYDFLNMWTFLLELEDVLDTSENDKNYPFVSKSIGEAPNQDDFTGFDLDEFPDEEMDIFQDLGNPDDLYFDQDDNFNSDFEDFDNEGGDERIGDDEYGIDDDSDDRY